MADVLYVLVQRDAGPIFTGLTLEDVMYKLFDVPEDEWPDLWPERFELKVATPAGGSSEG